MLNRQKIRNEELNQEEWERLAIAYALLMELSSYVQGWCWKYYPLKDPISLHAAETFQRLYIKGRSMMDTKACSHLPREYPSHRLFYQNHVFHKEIKEIIEKYRVDLKDKIFKKESHENVS